MNGETASIGRRSKPGLARAHSGPITSRRKLLIIRRLTSSRRSGTSAALFPQPANSLPPLRPVWSACCRWRCSGDGGLPAAIGSRLLRRDRDEAADKTSKRNLGGIIHALRCSMEAKMRKLAIVALFACLGSTLFAGNGGHASTIVFSDNFDGVPISLPGQAGTTLYPDQQKWAFTFLPGIKWPDSYGDGTNWLNGNAEAQTYVTPLLSSIKGDIIPTSLRYNPFKIDQAGLHIIASLLSPEQQAAYRVGGFRRFGSGILISRASFTYGKFRLVAKLPSARGSWPTFWLLPSAFVWPPEIDIFEGMAWGTHSKSIHLGIVGVQGQEKGFGRWQKVGVVDLSRDFHEYGLDWSRENLTFLFDGNVVERRPTPGYLNVPMYILINLAVGGKWPFNELGVLPIDGTTEERLARGSSLIEGDYPTEMIIRSIRVETID